MYWQDGCCTVCSIDAKLVTDHCHVSGLIRGMLCASCNVKEGNWHHCSGAIDRYRQRPPAALLDIRLRYYSARTGYAEPLPAPYRGAAFPWWDQLTQPSM